MIPQHKIQEIRQAAADDIVNLVREHVKLKKSGKNWKGLCPFHSDKNPSMIVSEEKGFYKCFVCQEGGDALDFWIKQTGQSFIEVVKELAEMYHIPIEDKDWKPGENYQPPEKIIPGISDMRSRIRREKYCILFFNEQDAEQFLDKDTAPWMQVSWPLKPLEAELLKKYTTTVFFRADSSRAGNDKFWHSMRVWLGQETKVSENLEVFILTDDSAPDIESYMDGRIQFPYHQSWLVYTTERLPPTPWLRKQLIKTIGSIKDNLTRSIYTRSFIDKWNERTLTIQE